MSNKIPDAWDDDWVNVADVGPPKCCKAPSAMDGDR